MASVPRLRSVPAGVPQAAPQSAPMASPAQQGWVWNGSNWMWDPCDCDGFQPPFPCPPSGFPTPCPPWFPPPAGQAPWYPGANGGVSFSATPPANPIRGNFWWDGTMLHLFDGAAWVDIGPSGAGAGGTFVGTSPPSNPASGTTWWNGTVFQVWDGAKWQAVGPPAAVSSGKTTITFAMQQTTSLTVAATAWTIVPYTAAPNVDTQSAWNASAFKLTPNVAGTYLIEVRSISPGGGASAMTIVKNDSGSFTSFSSSDIVVGVSNVSANQWMTAVGVASMNGTTDFIRVWGFAAGGSIPAGGSSPVYTAVLLP